MTKDQELRESLSLGGEFVPAFSPAAKVSYVLALLARAEQAEARATQAEAGLQWLASNLNCELSFSYGGDTDEPAWEVYRVTGGVNDREWNLVSRGPTPVEALLSALSTKGGGEGFIAARELPPSDAGRDGIEGSAS